MRRGRRIAGAIGRLLPGGLAGESFARLAPVLYRVRVLIGVSALGVAWVLPGASGRQRLIFVALVALLYLPYSCVLLVASRRRRGAGTWLASLVGDLLIVFLFHALLPPTQLVAMFGYLLITAFYAFVGGLRAGLMVAAGGMGLTLAAERLTSAAVQLSSYDLTMYGAVLVSFAVLLNAATAEQRRAAGLLEQEVAERARTEEALRERERQLVEAQALALRDRVRLGGKQLGISLAYPGGALVGERQRDSGGRHHLPVHPRNARAARESGVFDFNAKHGVGEHSRRAARSPGHLDSRLSCPGARMGDPNALEELRE